MMFLTALAIGFPEEAASALDEFMAREGVECLFVESEREALGYASPYGIDLVIAPEPVRLHALAASLSEGAFGLPAPPFFKLHPGEASLTNADTQLAASPSRMRTQLGNVLAQLSLLI